MSYTLGGAAIAEMDLTRSWGVTPASGVIKVMDGAPSVETEVSLTLGGTIFYGIVTNTQLVEDNGRSYRVEVADNRIWLSRDSVFCSFNGSEIIEDDPLTPGVDRKRKYWHILPENWDLQIRTYSETPMTAKEILTKIFAAHGLAFVWSFVTHSRLENPVYDLDADSGSSLANILNTICEATGLVPTLSNHSQLSFAIKGEGTAPPADNIQNSDRSQGTAVNRDTKVRVVGDRNLYQVMPVTLEADWKSHYEQYYDESTWIARVKAILGISSIGEANARAREITVRDYVTAGGGAGATDYGLFSGISRMDIPVWVYLHQIVYKAYRVPAALTINGIPLASLQLKEFLIQSISGSSSGSLTLVSGSYYPEGKAYCIAQGQPIDILDPILEDALTPEFFDSIRDQWRPVNEFNLDTKNNVFFFEQPLIRVGTGSSGLFIKPNSISDDPDNQDDLNAIVVPNAAVQITAASVRAALCFEGERYSLWKGSGNRTAIANIPNLCRHKVFTSPGGTGGTEIQYESGKTADKIADKIADARLSGIPLISSGQFTRHGTSGTALNGSVDRVTTTLRFGGGGPGDGISETVEYAKERVAGNFQSERELARRQRTEDLFPGQKELKESVRQIRLLAKLNAFGGKKARVHDISDALSSMQGNPSPSIVIVANDSGTKEVGTPVFAKQDTENGLLANATGHFIGVVNCANSGGSANTPLKIATSGRVNIRVQGPFQEGDTIFGDPATNYASTTGTIQIGQAAQSYTGTGIIVAKARIGGGGTPSHPLSFVNASTGATKRGRLIYGTLGGIPATGMSPGDDPPYYVEFSASGYIYAVMVFTAGDATTDPPTYPEMTWTAEFFDDLQASDPFAVDGSGTYYFLLASVSVTEEAGGTKITISSNVLGSQDTQICADGVTFKQI